MTFSFLLVLICLAESGHKPAGYAGASMISQPATVLLPGRPN